MISVGLGLLVLGLSVKMTVDLQGVQNDYQVVRCAAIKVGDSIINGWTPQQAHKY